MDSYPRRLLLAFLLLQLIFSGLSDGGVMLREGPTVAALRALIEAGLLSWLYAAGSLLLGSLLAHRLAGRTAALLFMAWMVCTPLNLPSAVWVGALGQAVVWVLVPLTGLCLAWLGARGVAAGRQRLVAVVTLGVLVLGLSVRIAEIRHYRTPSVLAESTPTQLADAIATMSERALLSEIDRLSGAQLWLLVFMYGESIGEADEVDLAAARERADALPDALQTTFYNGYAHTAPWDVASPEQTIEQIRTAIPAPHQASLFTGVMIRYTMMHRTAPDAVIAFAEDLKRSTGVEPTDGIRIGFQRGTTGSLAAAIDLAQTYPVIYQQGIFEELGWRAASDHGMDADRLTPLARRVPPPRNEFFVHGACRSVWSPAHDWEPFNVFLASIPEKTQGRCLDAIGFILAQDAGIKEDAARQILSGLTHEQWRQQALEAYGRSQNASHDWFNPDTSGFTQGAGEPPDGQLGPPGPPPDGQLGPPGPPPQPR